MLLYVVLFRLHRNLLVKSGNESKPHIRSRCFQNNIARSLLGSIPICKGRILSPQGGPVLWATHMFAKFREWVRGNLPILSSMLGVIQTNWSPRVRTFSRPACVLSNRNGQNQKRIANSTNRDPLPRTPVAMVENTHRNLFQLPSNLWNLEPG